MRTSVLLRRSGGLFIVLLFMLAAVFPQAAFAQDAPPELPEVDPRAGSTPAGALHDIQTGYDFATQDQEPFDRGAQLDSGGPDDYGYTWSDSVGFSWISATGGSIASLSNSSYSNFWVTLPFSFKYYENVYSGLYIARSGYLSFTTSYSYDDQQYPPDTDSPNNVIAPYWSPTYLASSSGVYYRSFGTAPNRYFVVQWNQVKGGPSTDATGGDDTFTYEVVLYENGDILFQYLSMSYGGGGWWCGGIGIEDSEGVDGLNYSHCDSISNSTAVRFTRPAPTSRIKLETNNYGSFVAPGGVARVLVRMKNTGDIGSEKYDLLTACGWPVSLEDASLGRPLVDTDSSGYPDTGWVSQGAWVTVAVGLAAPPLGNVADAFSCDLTVMPMQNPARSRAFHYEVGIPAPFAQVYTDLGNSGVSLEINEPAAQATYRENLYGEDAAVAEAPNGNLVYAWSYGRSLGNNYVYELYYAIRNASGGVVVPPTRLTNLSGATWYVSDWEPAVAVAPDGTIGIAWYRYQANTSNQFNYNIHFARLNPAGTLLGSIVNVTNLTTFAISSTNYFKRVYHPVIAATRDNRFALGWYQYYYTNYASNLYVNDIFMAVYGSGGNQVMPPTNITNDAPGRTDAYYYPGMAAVGSNRVLLTYFRYSYPDVDIYYQVRDSAGGVVKAATDLSNNDNGTYEYYADAVELSNGNILVAWRDWPVRYAVLDASYNVVASSQSLDIYGDYPSVTADGAGRGIVQTRSEDGKTIYYALVNSNGLALTPGLISQFSPQGYLFGWCGGAITSHTIYPTMSGVDLYLNGPVNRAALPGAATSIRVNLGNWGASTASTITVTMTKPADVDVGAINPPINCATPTTCTWTLTDPHLAFLGSGVLPFEALIPSSPWGTVYPLALHISSVDADGDLTNNDLVIHLISAGPTYLPAIFR